MALSLVLAGLVDLPPEYGIPSATQYIADYARRMNLASVPSWEFYIAFVVFRFSAILQGVYKRFKQGISI